ncbi:MAG: hypothetical protein DSM106950_41430 [Stigonema ocellatum SAG 48.90 = DSM 106950]|nr:hypothetical protein [Stigonema ocellatum SAG 48.90 = DSM 106950]
MPPTKRPKISIYVTDEQKAILEEWASKETRSVSNLVNHLIEQGISRYQSLNPKQGGIIPFAELVRANLQQLKLSNLGIKNLDAIATGKKKPSRAEFCAITSKLKISGSEKEDLFQKVFDKADTTDSEVTDGRTEVPH